jgi:hypothetical protein
VKEKRKQGGNFEERLLGELKAVVARRGAEQAASTESVAHSPSWRRAPRPAAGAVAVFAAAVAVLVFSSGGGNTPKAFAVEPHEGGGVTIQIYSAEDSAGLEGALAEAGIRSQVTWLPAGKSCREPRFTPSTVKTSAGGTIGGIAMGGPGKAMTIGVMSSEDEYVHSAPNISLDPASFRPDQTVVISGSRGPYDGDSEGGFEARMEIAEGPVEPCEPVDSPDGGILGAMNRVSEAEAAP